jgi:hypothetical protein
VSSTSSKTDSCIHVTSNHMVSNNEEHTCINFLCYHRTGNLRNVAKFPKLVKKTIHQRNSQRH